MKNRVCVVNFSKNEDIDFISRCIAEGYKEKDDFYCCDFLTVETSVETSEAIVIEKIFSSVPSKSLSQLRNIFPLLKAFRMMLKANTIVLCSPSIWNIIICLWVMISGKKMHAAIHDVDPHYENLRGKLYSLQNSLIVYVGSLFYVFSNFSKHRLNKRTSKTIHVLPLPSPVEKLSVQIANSVDKQYDFIWFGRPEKYKGYELLPEFARLIYKEEKTLLIVGNFSEEKEFAQRVAQLPNVKLVNSFVETEQLARYVKSAWVNICPYYSATQSGIISFCCCLGVPSLVHNVGGLADQIKDGQNGFPVSSILDEDAMLKTIEICHIEPKNVAEIYDHNYSTKKLIALIAEL